MSGIARLWTKCDATNLDRPILPIYGNQDFIYGESCDKSAQGTQKYPIDISCFLNRLLILRLIFHRSI
ncbi:MAG: hypothetical protein BGO25_04320 [Acidobacteriales bacterium 59-55]|nr:MAG: hypothetical protein BGO25_04320 [Acidobacteriales bacterium 59-55]